MFKTTKNVIFGLKLNFFPRFRSLCVPLPNQMINDILVGSEDFVILQDDLFNFCHFTENKNKMETDCISANQHETLDMIIVGEKYLVLATMSPVIKVYDLKLNKLMIATGGHR